MYDVIIVGARCAGAPTARLLAQRGLRVLLLDRAPFPSDTLSTHCITAGGVTQLVRWGLLDRVLATNVPYVHDVTLTFGSAEVHNRSVDGVGSTCPRRTVLDALLVDAAVEEGVEMRERTSVKDVLRENGRVVGVAGHDGRGGVFEERAPLVIGADGRNSVVAGAVSAEQYDVRQSRGSGFYAYLAGWPGTAVELGFNDGHFAGVFPTNDDRTCVFAGKADHEFDAFRRDVDRGYLDVLRAVSPRLGEWAREAKRDGRFRAFRAQTCFFRVPYGPGWALVGDAGYYKDPVTGHGITDAFRDAELLANAVTDGLGGAEPVDVALETYRARRDSMAKAVYDATQDIADLGWEHDRLPRIFMRFAIAVERERRAIAAF